MTFVSQSAGRCALLQHFLAFLACALLKQSSDRMGICCTKGTNEQAASMYNYTEEEAGALNDMETRNNVPTSKTGSSSEEDSWNK